MSQDGYTLVEMLVALSILALAMAGLAGATSALRTLQLGIGGAETDARAFARATSDLRALLANAGPFRAGAGLQLSGAERHFNFACGDSGDCSANLADDGGAALLTVHSRGGGLETVRLKGAAGARFVYGSQSQVLVAWPPVAPPPPATPPVLRSISVTARGGPVVSARLGVEQPFDCEYDPVSRDCRASGP